MALADAPDTIRLADPAVTKKMTKAGRIFVRQAKGWRELIVRASAMDRAFPDWRFLKRQAATKRLLLGDEGRSDTKRKLTEAGTPERVY